MCVSPAFGKGSDAYSTFFAAIDIVSIYWYLVNHKHKSGLIRGERTEYEKWQPTAIRNRVEVRNGVALLERLRERPAEENPRAGAEDK